MVKNIQKKLALAFELLLLGLSLSLLSESSVWAQKGCTEGEIKANIEKLTDEYSNEFKAIVECDSASIKPLIQYGLWNLKEEVNIASAIALGEVGQNSPDAAEALIHIVRRLADYDPPFRSKAAEALGQIGVNSSEVVTTLIQRLDDNNENYKVRYSAAEALGQIKTIPPYAIQKLIEVLENRDADDWELRYHAASALGQIGGEKAVNALINALRQDRDFEVRKSAASALGESGDEFPNAVKELINALPKDKGNNSVQGSIISSLGQIGANSPKETVKILIAELQQNNDREIYPKTVSALGDIAEALYKKASTLKEVKEAISIVPDIEKSLKSSKPNVPTTIENHEYLKDIDKTQQRISLLLKALKDRESSLLQLERIKQLLYRARDVLSVQLVFWVALIFLYPKYRWIQANFFWNPWVRNILGLWYVGLALTWIPFLRQKLFAPFKESLLSDAHLDIFNPQAYFPDSDINLKDTTNRQPIEKAIPEIRGQIILESESGLGKSMFLRHLVQQSKRITVYLPAKKCDQGVMEAIQAKLHGYVKEYPNFLKNLIYSGAIDICIDGLNEITPDTRAKITNFVESYFKGNIIMATQPLEWTSPATAKTYILQPLEDEKIEQFLLSRSIILPENAKLKGSEYEQNCKNYLTTVLTQQQSLEEQIAIRRMLSNPMDLTIVALMLAKGEIPDLLNLQKQQYEKMKADYERLYPSKTFPLKAFAETVYQMRLNDQSEIPPNDWIEELQCMERHKMVLSRQITNIESKTKTEWYFRHDKIQDFFIVQTFLEKENEVRLVYHISDPRFRGVYFLLASMMPMDAAKNLREELIQYAAETKDHTVSDTFIQLLRSRKA